MPYRMVEERCGRWWHYWWAGPATYIHAVDLGEDVPESFCEVAQPYNLLGARRGSIPVACVPLVYREGEGAWHYRGKTYARVSNLAKALAKAAETWPHWCRWSPLGSLPPSVLDVELLQEALLKMPILRPTPEELAIDFVTWSYAHPADFLHSEYIHLLRAKRAEEKWREICPHEDPRACYPGSLGETLAQIKERGLTPAVDSALFGTRCTRPWGRAEIGVYTERGKAHVYYVLGHVLREAQARKAAAEEFYREEVSLPTLDLAPIDVQGPIMRKARRRRPEPLALIEPLEDFPTSGQEGGPFAAFDL